MPTPQTIEELLELLERKLRENVLLMEAPESMRDARLEVLVRAAHERGSRWKGADYVRQAWLDYASALYRASLPVVRFELYQPERGEGGGDRSANKRGPDRAAPAETRAPAQPSAPRPPRPARGEALPAADDDDDLVW